MMKIKSSFPCLVGTDIGSYTKLYMVFTLYPNNLKEQTMLELIQYGGGIFSANCPKCHEALSTPADMSVNAFMRNEPLMGTCKTHGKSEMRFLAFEK